MDEPVKNQFFVRLQSEKPLTNDSVKIFYRIVSKTLPSGTIHAAQVRKPDGGLESVRLIHTTRKDGSHWYEIPLFRHLNENEANVVIQKVGELFEGELVYSYFEPELQPSNEPESIVELSNYDQLAVDFAKIMHGRWLIQKLEAGWRFGPDYDVKEKTSPLLKQWDDLPESLRVVDKELPRLLIALLNNRGYKVVSADEAR